MDRLLSPQTKRIVLVVLAVALVALAGCSTGDTTPTETTDDYPLTETTTDPADGTTTDPADETTTEPPASDVDPEELAANHAERIDAASSLTASQQVLVRQTTGGNTSVSDTQMVSYYDLADRVGLQTATKSVTAPQYATKQRTDKYTAGDETFLRANSSTSQQAEYYYDQQPYNYSAPPTPVNFTSAGWTGLYENMNASLQEQGTTEFGNETVTRYTASGQASLPVLSAGAGSSFSELDQINATVLVTDDGLVTSTTVRASGTSVRGTDLAIAYQYTVTDLNETTVTEPAWTENVNATG
ncbi:DUF7537 family lipoprotein [Halapricum hydrolyticum]|uniref:Uncharacterized protein n=1 Tax=Halapricum hydrolyticum TaxID=2979991 RepID=A0AAE3I9M1_9EURY|nr:hypothetical protein [Halapricum hydrolyticum]MCU4716493.1 hypothetical protein [Halapricum hydrolyticum]MCU4725902.1 hypothetical protein [Halapricum hydrolyticum]